jgi:tetratricopeptide (TPR) repeat protein
MLLLSSVAVLTTGGILFLVMSSSTSRAGSTSADAAPIGSLGAKASGVDKNPSSSAADAPASALPDRPLAAYQTELLEIAFDSATKFPVKPHLATRSKTQESVVEACFELDQPRRALSYVQQIDDWRRGMGYADYAFYSAQHGQKKDDVRHYLDLARDTAAHWMKDQDSQYWQIDRIKAAIARTHLVMGETQEAARFEAGTADFEAEKVEVLKASLLTPDLFDHEFELIDRSIATGNFDLTKSGLETAAQLFGKFYTDAGRRSMLEAKIKSSWTKLPLQIRIDLMIEMIEAALDHQDRTKALALVAETRELMESAPWLPEDRIPLLGKLAGLRHRAGDEQAAKGELDEAIATFDAEREKIQSFNRAGALRPLAVVYRSMGDNQGALALYRKAIEEGSVNPNARPRAVDLSATCCSMALHGVEPDAELKARIKQIRDGLVDPW